MASQSGQTSEFKLPPHLHFGLESCPTCGQTIPSDKLEEISGRIAAREHERKLAITAQVEKQYAIEKAAQKRKRRQTWRRSASKVPLAKSECEKRQNDRQSRLRPHAFRR